MLGFVLRRKVLIIRKCLIAGIIVSLLMFSTGCVGNNSSVNHRKPKFAMYLVQAMKASDAAQANINDLPLESEPILTLNDLVSYNWKEHKVKLKTGAIERLPKNIPLDGIPLVVIAEGERVYLGALWTPASSLAPDFPHMMILEDYLVIDPPRPWPAKDDPRGNTKIYSALKNTGKLVE